MCNVTPPSNIGRKSFSPVFVRESPVKGIAQSGNLTGESCRISNMAVELYALTQRWDVLHLEGLEQLVAMAPNIRLHREESSKNSSLQDQCDSLVDTYKNLCTVVASMGIIEKQFHSMELLKTVNEPTFLTWPASKFSEVSSRISQAYQVELKAKQRVVENIAHSVDKATITYYMALWMHQVYIDSDIKLDLESLLLETGLRSIC